MVKKIKKSKKIYLDNEEPNWEAIDPESKVIIRAYNWMSSELNARELKIALVTHAKELKLDKFIELLEDWKCIQPGKIAYMLTRGATLDDYTMNRFNERFNELIESGRKILKKNQLTNRRRKRIDAKKIIQTPEQREIILAMNLYNEIDEDLIDNERMIVDKNFVIKALRDKQPSLGTCHRLSEYFMGVIDEFALIGKDEQVTEGYNNLSRTKIIRYRRWYKEVLHDIEMFLANKKASRKPRKRKLMSVDKLIATINYKPTDHSLKIESIDPALIIKANALLIFNTKKRKVGIYFAVDKENGLSIKGTTIQGWDEKKSIQKTLRKPDEQLVHFRNVSLRRIMVMLNKNITGKTFTLNGRINSDTLLLKAFK